MIETGRLILRGWRDADLAPFAQICADPEVMRHLGGPQSSDEVAAAVGRQRAAEAARGHCFWAVERREDGALLGFCGLSRGVLPGTAVHDALEIGWRLRRDAWGRGFAREAAEAALSWGWAHPGIDRIAAWTVAENRASWGLMRRLGMTRRPELDFAHPAFPVEHPLSAHIVYTLDRPAAPGAEQGRS